MSNFGSFLLGTIVGAVGATALAAYQEDRRQEILDRFHRGPEIHRATDEPEKEVNETSTDGVDKKDTDTDPSEWFADMAKDVNNIATKFASKDFDGIGEIIEKYKNCFDHMAEHDVDNSSSNAKTYKISEDPNAAIGL